LCRLLFLVGEILAIKIMDSDAGFDFAAWKWKSLQQRRAFLFPVVSIFYSGVWWVIVNSYFQSCRADISTHCSSPWTFFALGMGYFFFIFHVCSAVGTLFSRWGMDLVNHRPTGWRLCTIVMISWISMLSIVTMKSVKNWLISEFELAQLVTAISVLGLQAFHHFGLSFRNNIGPVIVILMIPWALYKNNITVSLIKIYTTFIYIECVFGICQDLSHSFNLVTVFMFVMSAFSLVMQVRRTRYAFLNF
jgi:hypothetical protein